MTRVRFDPSFVEHERWERLGVEALALHVVACSYTVRTLSDGVLTVARVRTLTPLVADPVGVAGRLVADGIWQRLDDRRLRVCEVRDDLRHADGRGDEESPRTGATTKVVLTGLAMALHARAAAARRLPALPGRTGADLAARDPLLAPPGTRAPCSYSLTDREIRREAARLRAPGWTAGEVCARLTRPTRQARDGHQ